MLWLVDKLTEPKKGGSMNQQEEIKLKKRRKELFNELINHTDIIDGCLVKGNKLCGRKNCKCAKGVMHRHVVISRRKEKKTNIVYVSLANEKQAATSVESYSIFKELIQEICDINVSLFKNNSLKGNKNE